MRFVDRKIGILLVVAALLLILAVSVVAEAGTAFVIDFEQGLTAAPCADTVSSVYWWSPGNRQGMSKQDSAQDAMGTIVISGSNARTDQSGDLVVPGNAAMIFDATCSGAQSNCTGGDPDLYQPGQGNVLIVTEDGDCEDPDDEGSAGNDPILEFDFSSFGIKPTGNTVRVESITILDTDNPAPELYLYSGGKGGTLEFSTSLPTTPEGGIVIDHPIGVSGVDYMVIEMNGSGAIDDIKIKPLVIDLELTKQASDTSLAVGAQTVFTIEVFNRGPDDATGVEVKEIQWPSNLDYISDNPSKGSYDHGTRIWTVGSLPVGATETLEITAQMNAAGAWVNIVEVWAANENDVDSDPGDYLFEAPRLFDDDEDEIGGSGAPTAVTLSGLDTGSGASLTVTLVGVVGAMTLTAGGLFWRRKD